MRPLKITLAGDYWDCQIYMGRLYLWTTDGALLVYNWDEIVETFIDSSSDRLALSCAFTKGYYLYNPYLGSIFDDPDVCSLLRDKFKSAASKEYSLSVSDLQSLAFRSQKNPFDSLPTDTEIFNKQLYAATDSGLWIANAHKSRGNPVSSRPRKLWDCPILSLTANRYPQIALSAGSDGLYELNVSDRTNNFPDVLGLPSDREVEQDIWQLSDRHSLFASYAQLSVYNSSPISESFLAMFNWKTHEQENNRPKYQRVYDTNVNESSIFTLVTQGLSWGSGDRLYRASGGAVECVSFRNRRIEADDPLESSPFSHHKSANIAAIGGEVISAGVAYYGAILECENTLHVLLGDGTIHEIRGPVTKWRVYPRSKNYENHLHVILDDRVEIYSFNNDYFMEQSDKVYGMTFSNSDFEHIDL